MRLFNAILVCLLFPVTVFAGDEVKSQEYYDEQAAESLRAMTENLQTMTDEMVKYMNAMNKALNESMPELSQNMGKVISSMKPLAETMQKNVDSFAQEVQKQISSENVPAPESVVIPQEDNTDISVEIDEELARLQQEQQPKIKLFPSGF